MSDKNSNLVIFVFADLWQFDGDYAPPYPRDWHHIHPKIISGQTVAISIPKKRQNEKRYRLKISILLLHRMRALSQPIFG